MTHSSSSKELQENLYDTRVKTLRTDNSDDYISDEFKKYLVQKRIEQQFSIPRRPEHNASAERINLTQLDTI